MRTHPDVNLQPGPAPSRGIGFGGLLTIAFIVLKLTGLITWSWVWVLSPIWISVGLVVAIVGAYLAFIGAIALCACIEDVRRRRRQAVERAKAAPGNTPRG